MLLTALRIQSRGGPHAELARQVVLMVLFAEMLASGAHAGPPHAAFAPPRSDPRRPSRRILHDSLSGRRPRG